MDRNTKYYLGAGGVAGATGLGMYGAQRAFKNSRGKVSKKILKIKANRKAVRDFYNYLNDFTKTPEFKNYSSVQQHNAKNVLKQFKNNIRAATENEMSKTRDILEKAKASRSKRLLLAGALGTSAIMGLAKLKEINDQKINDRFLKAAEDDRDLRTGALALGSASAGAIGLNSYIQSKLPELKKTKLDIAAKSRRNFFFKKMRATKAANKIKGVQASERNLRTLRSSGILGASALGLAGAGLVGKYLYDRHRNRRGYV